MPQIIFIGDEEQRLARRLQDGDKSAAREFYDLYADYMAGICARYIANEEDVKDVFQNALVQALSHIASFKYRGADSLKAWVAKVTVNEALKHLRAKKRLETLPIDCDALDEAEEDFPSISDIPPDALRQMLSQLPAGYRTVLNLYVFEGKSHQEIASLVGIGKSSSASQLHRAKKLLAKIIRKYNDDNPTRR